MKKIMAVFSKRGDVNWPPRSSDLAPLDFFQTNTPQTIEELEDEIRYNISKFPSKIIQ